MFDKQTFFSVFVAFIAAGILLVILNALFGGWLAAHGVNIHGNETTGTPAK